MPPLFHHRLDDALDEIEILGFPIASPFDLLRQELPSALCVSGLNANKDRIVEIVGYLVTSKYTRTKRGDAMAFGTFIDWEGRFFDTTHFPQVFETFPFKGRGCYLIKGKVADEFGFYSLEVVEMNRLDFISRNDLVDE